MYRNTYVEINLTNIKKNVQKVIKDNNNYKYYFAVVKADSYSHYSNKIIKEVIDAGCNYLAVSSLDEALKIRKSFNEIPILCLGIIDIKYINKCIDKNITITVSSLEYARKLYNIKTPKIHLKIDTGMNRLGIKYQEELDEIYNNLTNIEGIFTHIYHANNKVSTNKQFEKFENIIKDKQFKIIHIAQSETILNYQKNIKANGCRLGIIMYGIINNQLPTFKLISHIVDIKHIKKGETVGYNGEYIAEEDEIIAILPIGYADGITRTNKGRNVYINDKPYEIVGNISMDMMTIKIDESITINQKVEIIKDNKHINEIAKHNNTIPYEIICLIGKRVPRKYKK